MVRPLQMRGGFKVLRPLRHQGKGGADGELGTVYNSDFAEIYRKVSVEGQQDLSGSASDAMRTSLHCAM